ncbi:substrate-binding domain-containing protein [Parasalinivibrio latis]|uniref:substrate-binding domain-containing protein n=1 Tax=Parasalinivibrio latis TaxID=2952610 RepID=UPI0030E5DE62
MATIKDVARIAGVSVATVSRVINKSPKASRASIASVEAAMAEVGYRPNAAARALVSQSSNIIGVTVADVSDPFFGQMVKSIDDCVRPMGKHLLIGNGYHDAKNEKEAIELLINNRVDGLVVHAKGLSDEQLIAFAKEQPAMVLINRRIDAISSRCVSLDNYRGAYLATEHLIKNGHTKIGYICSDHDIEDSRSRCQGYRDAMKANNLEVTDNFIAYGKPDEEGGEHAMIHLLGRGHSLTAVACYSDSMAAGVIAALDDNGIHVPSDVSVIGFDDGLIARYIRPRLTTIRYPIQQMAEQALHLSLSLAKGETPTGTLQFIPTLVRRYSVRSLN